MGESCCAFLFQRGCKSARYESERNHDANNCRSDGRNQKDNAMAYTVGGHGNNRENESYDEQNESEAKNPKGEESKDKAYPTGFDGG